jgi:hypothetical protein
VDENQFWTIIEESRDESPDEQNEKLAKILNRLEVAELVEFDRIFEDLLYKSESWDILGAACVLNGGCTDDRFEYFRRALIGAGRERFEAALRDPDSLADWAKPYKFENEEIKYVAYLIYQEKTGGAEFPPHAPLPPGEFSGEPLSENGDDLGRRFPKLWAKVHR